MKLKLLLLIVTVLGSKEKMNVAENGTESAEKIEQNIDANLIEKIKHIKYKKKSSKYIGVCYHKSKMKWFVQRHSKIEKKNLSNGFYADEETAAHASDTLARKLIANGEQRHTLNFPDDDTKVHAKKTPASKFIGTFYKENRKQWFVARWSKREKKTVHNGSYNDEKTAARASDTLGRKLMEIGEHGHGLNFPCDETEVYAKVRKRELFSSMYVGVFHSQSREKWRAGRWSKNAQKMVYNGSYSDEEIAACASDTLARQLIAYGEKGHRLNFANTLAEKYKLNFPGADTEVNKYWKKKRKRLYSIKYVEF